MRTGTSLFLLSHPADILSSACISCIRTSLRLSLPFFSSTYREIFRCRTYMTTFVNVVRNSRAFCAFAEKEDISADFSVLIDSLEKKSSCRIHLNAFSEDPKFYHRAISGRYLINPSSAFRNGFCPPRKLFSDKLRYVLLLTSRCVRRHGNMESLCTHGIVTKPK